MEKCKICKAEMDNFIDMNNGLPLVDGNVCEICNENFVLLARTVSEETVEKLKDAIEEVYPDVELCH